MDDMEIEHRLTRLEERVSAMETLLGESKEDRKSLHQKIDGVQSTLNQQKTFVGGILFTFGCIWALLVFTKDWFFGHFK